MCGGPHGGIQGETNVKGSYACTGFDGANRLASNSLIEALVFAQTVVQPSVDQMKSSCFHTKWEEYLFRHGWKPTMVVPEICEMRNLTGK
ncbi:L-aspartate oxidase, chloroplastic [Trifolium repens]|nr:L-aspartate oxidase, chloroplastic [Trifolium repens]